MKLERAARRFDRTELLDGYNGTLLGRGQLPPFDDAKRDAEVSERRTLSVSPGFAFPSHGVVQAAGVRYIVGRGVPDQFLGGTIREGHVIHGAPFLAEIRTLGQLCLAQPGRSAWANRAWVKYMAFTEQDSTLPRQSHIALSKSEQVPPGAAITLDGQNYIVRASDVGAAGIRTLLADDLPDPVQAELVRGTYNRVTETRTETRTPVSIMLMRWQSMFAYQTLDSPDFGPGDELLVVPKSQATPAVGEHFEVSGRKWGIKSVSSHEDVWLLWSHRLV